MKRKIIWLVVSCLMALSLVLVSCVEEEEEEEEEVVEEEEEEEEEVEPPEGEAHWWDKYGVPQYGGTYTSRIAADPRGWDPWYGSGSSTQYETLGWVNWPGIDPEEFDWDTARYWPHKYWKGCLAESWETTDFQTYTFHIPKGVHFQDVPPVNGREMDAYDVEYSWHRQCALGKYGFESGSPYANMRLFGPPVSVDATDQWTVVIKVAQPSLAFFAMIAGNHPYSAIVPHEVVDEYGDLNDWTRAIGTGPFIFTDYVTATSITQVKNPNYWCYDEHYPENRLPYIDKVKTLIIPDDSTALAAIRTGKIDSLLRLDWQHAESLRNTSPQLTEKSQWGMATGIYMPVDREPYNDIRVRKAMQMAIDLKTIAETYYGGVVDGTPVGHIGHDAYRAHYETWPQEVKDGYAYNPEGAKELLTLAGHPEGLTCNLTARSSDDMALYEILQYYLAQVNIIMHIDVMESSVWYSYVFAGKADLVTASGWSPFSTVKPVDRLVQLTAGHRTYAYHRIDDPHLEELYLKAAAATTDDEQMTLCREGDLYAISQQWAVIIQPTYNFNFYQPWVKRYVSCEASGQTYSHLYIDQELKKSLGY